MMPRFLEGVVALRLQPDGGEPERDGGGEERDEPGSVHVSQKHERAEA